MLRNISIDRSLAIIFLAVLCCAASAMADRQILADDYLDKLQGMWLGEIAGNYAGRGYFDNGGTQVLREGAVKRGGWDYDIGWDSFLQSTQWVGDDDTNLEYMYMTMLAENPAPSNASIGQAWSDHVNINQFFIANRQAAFLINDGMLPPETGSMQSNMAWFAIDSQITTETIGSAVPGMRQRAADLAGQFGSVSNSGYALHAAQYYAAMYSAAAIDSDVETLVNKGLEVVPTTSRTHDVIQDVIDWYTADAADGTLDWRATQTLLYDNYGWNKATSNHRYRFWIESTVNTGATTMALLYGQGDYKDTVEIGILAGWDTDCNAATAGGLVGMVKGYSQLPADVMAATDNYDVGSGVVGVTGPTTITGIAQTWQSVAEAQIIASGGSITGEGASRIYHLIDDDTIAPLVEKPDPTGPGGLVGLVLANGGTVTPTAAVDYKDATNDHRNLNAIIDGITDLSYNGHLPYWSEDGIVAQPAGGDFYQLDFDRDVTFTELVFYEGGINWSNINGDPSILEPRGGYFLNLIVEVGDDGVFTEVANLHMSDPLEAMEFFQEISLSFVPTVGDAIRIRGDAGGTLEFTSIVELIANGFLDALIAGDINADRKVSLADLTILATNFNRPDGGNWADGDLNGDGQITLADLTILATNFGYDATEGDIPEPATALLLALGAGPILLRRRR